MSEQDSVPVREELRTSLDACVRACVPGPAHAVEQAIRQARSRGVPVDVLQRRLHQAHRRFVEEVARVYAEPEPGSPTVVDDGEDRLRALIEVLSDDHPDDREAERVLGLRLADHHWAAVLWAAPDRRLAVEDLVRFGLRVARAVGGSRPLVAVNGATEVWMWIRWATPPRAAVFAEARARLAPPMGVRVGAGPVGREAVGFRRSLMGARAAQRTVGEESGTWWCDHADVPPVSLLTNGQEMALWFVEESLGELGRDDPWRATLRETLRLYLATGRSRQQVAAALYINRNTVAYRVRKATALLGRPIEEDTFDVRLALEIARWMRSRPTAPPFRSSRP